MESVTAKNSFTASRVDSRNVHHLQYVAVAGVTRLCRKKSRTIGKSNIN
jgi:hypothetical protein